MSRYHRYDEDRASWWRWFIAAILFTVLACAWGATRIIKCIQLDIVCTGHLKRAADANTIDLAKQELRIAVDYLEKNHYTEGSTALIFNTPDADIGFWHQNLKASLTELEESNPDASRLEKSNMLIKLRETLLDHGEKGVSVTCPGGMSIYPYNWPYCIWACVSILFAIIAWIGVTVKSDNW